MADAISSPPTVTVIVPVRDRAGMLRDLLESLLTQDYPASRMELIVVDGDSRDAIAEIVGEYARHAPFAVRYLQIGDDRGPVPKRNLGARNANGEILAFTDSDCRTTPGCPGTACAALAAASAWWQALRPARNSARGCASCMRGTTRAGERAAGGSRGSLHRRRHPARRGVHGLRRRTGRGGRLP